MAIEDFDELAMQGTWKIRLEKCLERAGGRLHDPGVSQFIREVAQMLTLRDKRIGQLQSLSKGMRTELLSKERV